MEALPASCFFRNHNIPMKQTAVYSVIFLLFTINAFSQKKHVASTATGPIDIAPVGIIKNVSDSVLLDIVQRQTFRYFWDFAHPVSGLARERDNTVKAEYYWDYINEADGEPNLSKINFWSRSLRYWWDWYGDFVNCCGSEPWLDR